jgi:hypothetical protein
MGKYIRIDKGKGVRVTLTVGGWACLSLAAGYFTSEMSNHRAELVDLLGHLPRVPEGRGFRRGRGRKQHVHIPPSEVERLKTLMGLIATLRSGFLEAPQTNIAGALGELSKLSVIDLLAAVAETT